MIKLEVGNHYETIVTFYTDTGEPWATPLGIFVLDTNHVLIKTYRGTTTHNSLLKGVDIAINIVKKLDIYLYTSLKKIFTNWKNSIKFSYARTVKAPIILDSEAVLEAVNEYTLCHEEYALHIYKIVNKYVLKRELEISPISRAYNHMLEIAVYLTKILYVQNLEKIVSKIKESINLISRICKTEECEKYIKDAEYALKTLLQHMHQVQGISTLA